METDRVEIFGLENLLDEEDSVPYIELTIRCHGRGYRVRVLRAEEEWALHVQEEGGTAIPGQAGVFATQSQAIVAAALHALDAGQRNPLN